MKEIISNESITCQSGMMLTTLCLDGAGIALRSKWDVAGHIANNQLVEVLPKTKIEDFAVLCAVVPNRRLISGKVRAFLSFLEK